MTVDLENKNPLEPESGASTEGDRPVLTGTEIGGATPVRLNNRSFDGEIAAGSAIVQTIWAAWIEGFRMRLKIKRDLGRNATDEDLTSIDTWTKVDEVEQRNGSMNRPK